MKPAAVVRLVATRELRQRVRSKGFVASAGISVAIILAAAILPGLVGRGPTTYDVAVGGPAAAELAGRLVAAAAGAPGEVRVEVRRGLDRRAAADLVRDGELDAYLEGDEVVVDRELGDRLGAIVGQAHQLVAVAERLDRAGVASSDAAEVLAPAPLRVVAQDPRDQADADRQNLVAFGTFLLYGQLLGFGYWVASGVVEEKSSRVVELLLARATPAQLLAGKIAGIGVLGFVQLVGFVAVGLVAATASGTVDLPPGMAGIVALVLGWFVLGFAFYACLFAVAGALASRVEEMQNTTTPVTLVAFLAIFAAIAAGSDPGGAVATVATFVPPTAPLVLPIRSAAGELPLWQAAASATVVLAAIVAVVRLAARAYTGGALHTRGQLKLREALRAAP